MPTFEEIYASLADSPRLLLEAALRPIQGSRFQPTGFPNLGAAVFERPGGAGKQLVKQLLVESPQSMANRLEAVCWDDASSAIVPELAHLPHIRIELDNGQIGSSLLEAHRLNSPFITNDSGMAADLKALSGADTNRAIDKREIARALVDIDIGSLLHGVFVTSAASGRIRFSRIVSAFIEADDVIPAHSGGVKLDLYDAGGDTGGGRGNVPFSRVEYTAKSITAYFSVDLTMLRGYGLGETREKMIVALALYKILRLLEVGLRLRTACDLELESLKVTRPKDVQIDAVAPLRAELAALLPSLIAACGYGEGAVRTIKASVKAKSKKSKEMAREAAEADAGGDESSEGEQ